MASNAPSEIVTAAVAAWIDHRVRQQSAPWQSQIPYQSVIAVGGIETVVTIEPEDQSAILATTAGCRYRVRSNWQPGQRRWQGILGAEPVELSITQLNGDLLVCDGKSAAVVKA
jgi:hypothetical protein